MRTPGQERFPGRGPQGREGTACLVAPNLWRGARRDPACRRAGLSPPSAPVGPLLGARLLLGKTGAAFSLLPPRPSEPGKAPSCVPCPCPVSVCHVRHRGCLPLPHTQRASASASLPRQTQRGCGVDLLCISHTGYTAQTWASLQPAPWQLRGGVPTVQQQLSRHWGKRPETQRGLLGNRLGKVPAPGDRGRRPEPQGSAPGISTTSAASETEVHSTWGLWSQDPPPPTSRWPD